MRAEMSIIEVNVYEGDDPDADCAVIDLEVGSGKPTGVWYAPGSSEPTDAMFAAARKAYREWKRDIVKRAVARAKRGA